MGLLEKIQNKLIDQLLVALTSLLSFLVEISAVFLKSLVPEGAVEKVGALRWMQLST